ncbi:hypothetical protein PMAYCL1PPCAC_04859 [Pristionchus mayeri]|uniref:Uncharacterized protein n=1 Tax=Pristionchus mayeri TaxID=1317129 RepID=A0AAN4Z7Q8_9BILA|nr:hypothetical protein PMAYCL1PPCAC_04859 [Pristionchus mayeri]
MRGVGVTSDRRSSKKCQILQEDMLYEKAKAASDETYVEFQKCREALNENSETVGEEPQATAQEPAASKPANETKTKRRNSLEMAEEAVAHVAHSLKDAVKHAGDAVSSVANEAYDEKKETIEFSEGFVSHAAHSIFEGAKDVVKHAGEAVSSAAHTVYDDAKGFVNFATDEFLGPYETVGEDAKAKGQGLADSDPGKTSKENVGKTDEKLD